MSDPVAAPARLTGWGRCTGSVASVADVQCVEGLQRLVGRAANGGVVARGLGRSYGDAAQNAGAVVVGRWQPSAAIDLVDGGRAVHVTAGTSWERILRTVLPAGAILPVLPGTRFVTAGGAVAADVHGKNHHVDGSLGRWVRELTVLDGLGHVRRLSAEHDPKAFRATVGGMGLTGIVLDATIDLVPVSTAWMRVRTRRLLDLDTTLDAMESSPARHHVAWVDTTGGASFGRAVLDEGDHACVDDLSVRQRRDPLTYRPRQYAAVPPLPISTVRPEVVRVFNRAWWHRAPADATRTVSLTSFFHPLDAVARWNRLYGPRGFLQWQCVVPLDERELLIGALRRLAGLRMPPSLTVVKRFGAAGIGPLSFAVPGWTVAVDVATQPGLDELLDRLDAEVAAAGGRIYLAKDSRLAADRLPQMYPRLAEWRQARDAMDPHGVFGSDLGRRLGLV